MFRTSGGIYRACAHVVLRWGYLIFSVQAAVCQHVAKVMRNMQRPSWPSHMRMLAVGQCRAVGERQWLKFLCCDRWRHSAPVGGFSSDRWCWISGGACEWEKSLWLVVQLSKPVHRKRKRCEESKQMTKCEKALLPVPFSTFNEIYSQFTKTSKWWAKLVWKCQLNDFWMQTTFWELFPCTRWRVNLLGGPWFSLQCV